VRESLMIMNVTMDTYINMNMNKNMVINKDMNVNMKHEYEN
jgi:hypothetical protein